MSIHDQISTLIKNNDIVLFMKGTPVFPQCGFSARVVDILKTHHVNFETVNVLESDEMRAGIKSYSNWPTIPQLYVKNEFIGGCDIVNEMHESGELKSMLENI
tara:strand:- start:2115 stop:2423 length:309 start_codon:yes stop_codon:yes gene_type:complete